jgi:coenzyme F420-0:L-glutamate ligase/coenzyme F420-1:gamma-L-glutamate ligase
MAVHLLPLRRLPPIHPGDDLGALLAEGLLREGFGVKDGDVLVVCQKAVSKAEGRLVDLRSVEPGPRAKRVAEELGKDPRVVEVILRESRRIVRMEAGHLIVETRHGFVCANAGVDESNSPGPAVVVLLPLDPDGSAARLRSDLGRRLGVEIAVVITDTFGRPWREGLVEFAIGVAGLRPLLDLRGRKDLAGRELQHTVIAVADELAAAAGLLMEKDSGTPAVLVRGFRFPRGEGSVRELLRDPRKDLFR